MVEYYCLFLRIKLNVINTQLERGHTLKYHETYDELFRKKQ